MIDIIRADFDAAKLSRDYRSFFVKYMFFTTNDLSQMLGLSAKKIRVLKKGAGLGKTIIKSPKPIAISIPKILDKPDNWDTPEWWSSVYPKYGMYVLCRVTGLSKPSVRKRIKRYCGGTIPVSEAVKSKHPYANKEWLLNNYVKNNFSLFKCASLAGVSPDTIIGWLNRNEIQLKTYDNSTLVGKISGF